MEEDRRLRAKTIPVRFGPDLSLSIILASLALAWIMTGVVFYVAPPFFEFYHVLSALALAAFLLLLPAWQLFRSKSPEAAMTLFNKASYFFKVIKLHSNFIHQRWVI